MCVIPRQKGWPVRGYQGPFGHRPAADGHSIVDSGSDSNAVMFVVDRGLLETKQEIFFDSAEGRPAKVGGK